MRADADEGLRVGLADDLGLDDPEDVLNGIAYDSESCRVFVTGKRWPKLFEIEVR